MIFEKLMRVQTQIKAPKNLFNSFGKYKYRNAEGICEAVKPYLEKENLSLTLSDEIVEVGGRVYVKATATLTDLGGQGQTTVTAYAREAEKKAGMDDSQITGTASSYARKYALNGMFLLDDTKDADTDEYHEQTHKEPAKPTKAQMTVLKNLCDKHNINLTAWAGQSGKTIDTLTADDVGTMLNRLKKEYGDD